MRVTNMMMINNFLGDLSGNLERLGKYQGQLASNRKLNRMSDDPIAIIGSLEARAQLDKLNQYGRSLNFADMWLRQNETSLMELNECIMTGYENAVRASAGVLSDVDKKSVASLIGQLKQQVLQIANASCNGHYIFGGYNTTGEPFVLNGTALEYNGIDIMTMDPAQKAVFEAQKLVLPIGPKLTMQVSYSGTDVIGTGADNIYALFEGLQAALESNAGSDVISQFAGKLNAKQSDILSVIAEIGRRQERIDLLKQSYSKSELDYTNIKSTIEDVDLAEATMQYKLAEAVYKNTLQVGSQIIRNTLLDYLR